jgi:hypothetical protein
MLTINEMRAAGFEVDASDVEHELAMRSLDGDHAARRELDRLTWADWQAAEGAADVADLGAVMLDASKAALRRGGY